MIFINLPVSRRFHKAEMTEMLERSKVGSEFRGHFLAFWCIYLSKGAVYKHSGLSR